jgi:cytochrome b561
VKNRRGLHTETNVAHGPTTRLARLGQAIWARPDLWNTTACWGVPAKFLHWTIALLLLLQIPLGWAAVSWRLSPMKLDLYVWHKSAGMLILVLMLVRIAWRWVNVAPSLPAEMPPIERLAARWSHVLLYVLLILMPITGWVINSAAKIPFRIFWLIPLPAIVAPDKALADGTARVHLALFIALSLLLVIHVGAALRHHFVKHNTVLTRMLPGWGGVE